MSTRRPVLKSIFLNILSSPYKFGGYLILGLSEVINLFKSGLGTRLHDKYLESAENRKGKVTHTQSSGQIFSAEFFAPNFVCKWRVNTFSTKEPETLNWIDEFGAAGPMFDIGANIGLYSIYFAKTKNNPVYAFEPSVFNLKQLAKNVYLNNVSDLVNIVTAPLADSNGFAQFKLSSLQEGGALSTFGVDYGQDGNPLKEELSFRTLGFSLDYLTSIELVSANPALIKIDVDGIEDLILKGGERTLKNLSLKSVLVEVTPKFDNQLLGVRSILTEAGFKLRNDMDDSNPHGYNQIWVR